MKKIAERAGRMLAQVLLRWCLERDLRVPKSTHRERIEETPGLRLRAAADDMAALDALDETGGTDQALERQWW